MAHSRKYRRFDEDFIQQLEKLYLISKKVLSGGQFELRKRRKVASGIEFADYRNYAPGDDMRTLDWRIYARTEKLLLRLFEEKEELDIHILVDRSASMAMGTKLDHAARLAASMAYIGLRNMDRVSVHTFDTDFERGLGPLMGRGQIFKFFDLLDKIEADGGTEMRESIGGFAAQTRRRGLAVVISDFYDADNIDACLRRLRYAQFETHVIHVVDRDEAAIVAHGDFEFIDCETGDTVALTATPAMIAAYRKEQDRFQLEIEALCARRGMLYCVAPTQLAFQDVVLRIFRAGGFIS